MILPKSLIRMICTILFAFLVVATGCTNSNKTKLELVHESVESSEQAINSVASKRQAEYDISFCDSSWFSHINSSNPEYIEWKNNFIFKIIRLDYTDNTQVYNNANYSIALAMISWVKGKVLLATSVDLEIYCHSDRYLSFANIFEYSDRRIDYIRDYITIDIKTGERVMLNDLVEINEEFVKHIRENNIATSSNRAERFDSVPENIWEFLNEMSTDELLKKLETCSYTQEQVIQNGYFDIDESIEALVLRNSFYLRDDKLIIVLNEDIHVIFNLEDISDYLKVEKW